MAASGEGERGAPLWEPDELAAAVGGRWLRRPPKDWAVERVSYDVRGLPPNHLVICKTPRSWRSDTEDTARELPRLCAKGAAGAIIETSQRAIAGSLPEAFPLLLVENTRKAMAAMARAARARFGGKVVAVTGTNGKTTTRELLVHMLNTVGGGTGNRGNNNNVLGVERTLAYTGRDLVGVAIEMGFGRPLDGIEQSSLTARPHGAILTNVSPAHLDMFEPGLEVGEMVRRIAQAKSGIVAGLEPGGVVAVGETFPFLDLVRERLPVADARIVRFGESADNDVGLLACRQGPFGSAVAASVFGTKVAYRLKLPGRHMAVNSLGALGMLAALGLDVARLAAALETFEPVMGRARPLRIRTPDGGEAFLIDDHFNATPTSMRSCLEVLAAAGGEGRRRIAVLGEMQHLVHLTESFHAAVGEHAARLGIEVLLTNGPLMRHCHDAAGPGLTRIHTDTLEELYAVLRETLRGGDVVALKGGRGVGGLGDIGFRRIVRGLVRNRPTLPEEKA